MTGTLKVDGLTIRDGNADLNVTSYYGGRLEYNGGGVYTGANHRNSAVFDG